MIFDRLDNLSEVGIKPTRSKFVRHVAVLTSAGQWRTVQQGEPKQEGNS